jgi:hypothetical protein
LVLLIFDECNLLTFKKMDATPNKHRNKALGMSAFLKVNKKAPREGAFKIISIVA